MLWASRRVDPVAPVLPDLSQPAKSTKASFDLTVDPSIRVCVVVMVTTTCDRDDKAFILVDAVDRANDPICIKANTSLVLWHFFFGGLGSRLLDLVCLEVVIYNCHWTEDHEFVHCKFPTWSIQ